MKKFFLLLALTALTVSASAQITWNAKGGIGIAFCYGDTETKSKLVGKIGVGIEKPLSANLSLMPSIEIAMKGANYEEEYSYGSTYTQNVSIYYAQIPVLLAYRFNLSDSWNMTIKAGPYVAYGFAGNMKESYEGESANSNIFDLGVERFDAGVDLGVDFEHHKFVFGVEVEYGLLNMVDGVKNFAAYATIGWKF